MKKHRMKDSTFVFLMLCPAILSLLLFTYYPLLRGIVMAFQNYNLFNIKKIEWIGLDNFREIFARTPGNMFYDILLNTLRWVVLSLFFQFTIGFGLALLLEKQFFGRDLYQGIIFFPWAVSGFIIGIIWRFMFNGTGGVINDILLRLGILDEAYGFLANPKSAPYAVIIANIWYGVPFFVIMISAALQSVPRELYEAAEVDGGSHWQRFRFITLPIIKPVLVLTTLLRGIWIFNFPELIVSMTNGGPGGSTHILTSYMMEKVNTLDYGMGSALGVIVMLILSLYAIIYLKISGLGGTEDM